MSVAVLSLLVASAAAQGLALVTAISPLADRAIRPLAAVAQVTPVIAIAPLVIIWFGLDHPQRPLIVLAALVAFFPIFSGAVTGLKSADPDLERLFDLYGARRWQRVTRLRLPSAVPFLLEGHKVGAGLALIGAVVAEFSAGSGGVNGLAWQILDAYNKLQTARMIAALVVLGAMGVALHAGLEALERAGLRWWRGR
jgi:NitT/TauT family transport system permease protein